MSLASQPASESDRPALPAVRLATMLALIVAGVLLAVWLWSRICRFPSIPWNDMRLAPTIALSQGWPVYPTATDGTIGTWMYGPLPLLFFWPELERQIRIEGRVETVSAADSDEYYQSRPALSRIGAWASPQSQVLASRTALEARFAAFSAEHGDNPPRPAHWGGYRVVPSFFEFWQGRRSRLHDRICYRMVEGKWKLERLAP